MTPEQIISKFAAPDTARLARLLTIALLVLFPAATSAQVEPIDPVWMTVTRDTPMRCGDEPTFYKVATLKKGTVVRMDAKNIRFGRIEYPPGTYAFVARNDAEVLSDKALKLAGDKATIRSPNAISGLAGSWRSLYFGAIKPDATLEIIAPVKTPSGQITGYKVVPPRPPVAPHPPYGFVELAAMRRATPDEIRAYLDALKNQPETPAETTPEKAPAGDTPSANPTADQPRTGGNDTPGASDEADATTDESPPSAAQAGRDSKPDDKPETEATDTDQSRPDTSLLQDMILPGAEKPDQQPTDQADSAEADQPGTPPSQQAENQPEKLQPEKLQPAKPQPEKESPEKPKQDWLGWNELESTLAAARAAGRDTLEDSLDELIAEYSRSLAHAQTEPMRRALRSRLDWLQLRKSARDTRLELDAALEKSRDIDKIARQKFREWQSGRYDIVGRLVPSAVYNGKTLPRMYRIRAAGETGLVRTIGYLKDVPSLELESKIGRVVGVVGKARFDKALHVRIITPSRIDILRPTKQSPASNP